MDTLYRDNLRLVALGLKTFHQYCELQPSIPKTAVIISSNAGCVARPNQAMYAAVKAGVISLARSVAVRWGPANIRVNVIAPGTVMVSRNETSVRSRLSAPPLDPTRPLGRIALPNDLDCALNLFLTPGILITGQVLIIDSGSSL